MRKPPVPIPNTVVKTHSSENTWRATAWEDNPLPTPKLKRELNCKCDSVLFNINLYIDSYNSVARILFLSKRLPGKGGMYWWANVWLVYFYVNLI